MRLCVAASLLVLLSACGGAPTWQWVERSDPRLGVKVDMARDWGASSIDDVLLLIPRAAADDYVIGIFRATAPPDDAAVIGRLGKIGNVTMAAPPETRTVAGHPARVSAGTGVWEPTHQPVVLRVARIDEGAGHTTTVVAVMQLEAEKRGVPALEHVLQSLALLAPPAVVPPPKPPAWLTPTPEGRPTTPDEPSGDDDSSSELRGVDGAITRSPS
jgi:hypothetical protein